MATVYSVASDSMCGATFSPDRSYLVFASRSDEGDAWTGLCSGNKVLDAPVASLRGFDAQREEGRAAARPYRLVHPIAIERLRLGIEPDPAADAYWHPPLVLVDWVAQAVAKDGVPDEAPRVPVSLTRSTSVSFASEEEGRRLIAADDDFFGSLTPTDRALRMARLRDAPHGLFVAFAQTHVRRWDDDAVEKAMEAVSEVGAALDALQLDRLLPPDIRLVLTSGGEELSAAGYTRGDSIFTSAVYRGFPRVLAHEIFHLVSKRHPAIRERVYAEFGFYPIPPLELPSGLRTKRITNPDSLYLDHAVPVSHAGRNRYAVEIWVGEPGRSARMGLETANPKILLLDEQGRLPDGEPELFEWSDLADLAQQPRAGFSIDPEEVAAEQFAWMMLRDAELLPRHRPLLEILGGQEKSVAVERLSP